MATKINPDFYGAENTFVEVESSPYVKRSASTVGALKTGGIYTGGSFDFTASPWGIGESSISSDFSQTISKSATFDFHECINKRKNTPFWLYYNTSSIGGGDDTSDILGSSVSSPTWARLIYKNRLDPDININNNRAESLLTIDNGDTVDVPNSVLQYPVTMLDYQHVKLVIGDIWVKPVDSDSIQRVSFSDIVENNVDVDKIIRITTETHDNTRKLNLKPSIGGSALDIPEIYKSCYYGDKDTYVRPWRYIYSVGYWYYDVNYLSTYFVYDNSDNLQYTTSYDEPTSDDILSPLRAFNYWGHLTPKLQNFDDVSYHWEYGLSTYSSNQFNINPIRNGDTYQSGVYRAYCYMDIDDLGTHATKNAAFAAAILHEFAFMGLPIVTSVSDRGKAIGDNDVYLPVFDEHLITTGEFISGAESLNLPNALWNDIFGAEMPEYDPEYEPDEPIPAGDYGDTNNLGSVRATFPNGFKVYLMAANTYYQFLQAINSYYNDKTPDDWTVDFQGVNPSDYILNCYTTKLALPHSATGESIKIGNITLNVSAYTLSQTDVSWCTFDYGTRLVAPRYNDFRDYAPYTSIELYLPLAGTIAIDVNYCMGHNITVKYYYDVLTMSCVAAVYRDNMLYKCADCKIGAEIPLLSSNMGSYQNQIEQLSVARQRNNIAIATSGAAAIAGTTAAIATGSPMAVIGAAGGFSKLAGNITESNNLDYQFDHIAPSVSTTGAADPQNNLCVGQLKPKLIIKRPVMLSGHNDTIYSKTVGNACCINDYIGSRTGLVVCSNINANDIVNAYGESPTADEINSIKQAFANGVYV